MSTRATGAARERAFEYRLWQYGYRTARFSSSGERISEERKENGICGDLIGFAPISSGLPHIIVEIGGSKKSLAVAFAELTEHPIPGGFRPIVARCVARSWSYYTTPESQYNDFASFI